MFTTLRQRFSDWAQRRQRYDHGTVTLTQRSIYIIPTWQGVAFAVVLGVMLLGDINYNLSLGYVLTFLLATMGFMSMLHAFRNMARLEIRAGRADPAFAGGNAQFVFHFSNPGTLARYRLHMEDPNGHGATFDIPARQSTETSLLLPATQRGWLAAGRLTLSSEFPLGLFYAWSYLNFETRALVYPRPAAPLALPPAAPQQGSGATSGAGEEDFAGLRGYVAGDALQRIAWKALAREQGLQVKQFSAAQGQEMWLDWSAAPAPGAEEKLQILTRWVLDADAQGSLYGLRLPGEEFAPERGAAHRDTCLRALALFGLG